VGIGKCRKPDGVDVMCPSFMVLREERHTTRGRARLLFEMLDGEVIQDRWRSPEVKDALDLCLSCKGCTKDCPVHVDMPTYKAEFLHHHYEGRLRPRHAYAFGLIDQACRLGAAFPGVTNLVGSTAPLARAVKLAAGVTGRRPLPNFSAVTLQRWFRARRPRNVGRPQVVVWPDTFTNHFRVQVGIAAVEAIEAAGWQVVMPEGHVCCGRPLYDYGFLDLAERYLRRSIVMVRRQVRGGIPVVGIEPSCVAVFRDELPKLLPHDDDGRRLTECASHFSEFFLTHNLEPPRLDGRALLWGHCHQKATGGIESERALLEQMGLAVDTVTGGCCGLAGSWGFEDAHYDLSMAIGEKALLPEVRHAAPTTLIVADGFSCGTQIRDGGTGREALHLAQVMQLARTRRDLDAYPERDPVLQGPRRLHRFAGRTPGR
jgi:Fe-S oxidoreductase